MNSEQIRKDQVKHFEGHQSGDFWLSEIALQLAELNEARAALAQPAVADPPRNKGRFAGGIRGTASWKKFQHAEGEKP